MPAEGECEALIYFILYFIVETADLLTCKSQGGHFFVEHSSLSNFT
jgi:hypothetical protein